MHRSYIQSQMQVNRVIHACTQYLDQEIECCQAVRRLLCSLPVTTAPGKRGSNSSQHSSLGSVLHFI